LSGGASNVCKTALQDKTNQLSAAKLGMGKGRNPTKQKHPHVLRWDGECKQFPELLRLHFQFMGT